VGVRIFGFFAAQGGIFTGIGRFFNERSISFFCVDDRVFLFGFLVYIINQLADIEADKKMADCLDRQRIVSLKAAKITAGAPIVSLAVPLLFANTPSLYFPYSQWLSVRYIASGAQAFGQAVF